LKKKLSGGGRGKSNLLYWNYRPLKLQNYAIVYELLHYHLPNHEKLWKSLMKLYLGQYENLKKQLKKFSELH